MFEMGAYFVGFFGLKKLAESWVLVSFFLKFVMFCGFEGKKRTAFW